MNLLCDNWLEIMKHCGMELLPLRLTCKTLYQLFINNKDNLCDEGFYQFTPFQRLLLHDLNHITNRCVVQPYHNKGVKATLLTFAMHHQQPVMIIVPDSDFDLWKKEVNKLYHDIHYTITYFDVHITQYIKLCIRSISGIGYIIINQNAKNNLHVFRISYLNDYSCNIIVDPLSLWNDGRLQYKGVYAATIITHHHCCYRDEIIGNVYLSPENNNSDDRVNMNKRLNNLIDDIIVNRTLIVNDGIDKIEGTDYFHHTKSDKRIVISFDMFLCDYFDISCIIMCWPSHINIHKMYEIYNRLKTLNNNVIDLHLIHSTIEEAYVDRSVMNEDELVQVATKYDLKLLKSPRKLMAYLE